MDTRTEIRCWRALAGAGLIGAVLLGCGGGGDDVPPMVAAFAATSGGAVQPSSVALQAPVVQLLPAPATVPDAPVAPVASAAPCDRAALPPHGAQAALHLEQHNSERDFDALAETARRAHAGTMPAADTFEAR